MNLPSHLKHYSKRSFLNTHGREIEEEFSFTLSLFNLDFDKFLGKLDLLEKAVFSKIGFIFYYYIKKFECERCECSHQTEQLRFLACISVIEALLGNAKKRKVKKNKKEVDEPIVATFLTKNLLPSEKKEILKMMPIIKDTGITHQLFRTFAWRLVDMRNGFMHRAELIPINGIYKHRLHHGRSGGISMLYNNKFFNGPSFFEKLTSLIKISIVRYLLITPNDKRKPAMDHRQIKSSKKNSIRR